MEEAEVVEDEEEEVMEDEEEEEEAVVDGEEEVVKVKWTTWPHGYKKYKRIYLKNNKKL